MSFSSNIILVIGIISFYSPRCLTGSLSSSFLSPFPSLLLSNSNSWALDSALIEMVQSHISTIFPHLESEPKASEKFNSKLSSWITRIAQFFRLKRTSLQRILWRRKEYLGPKFQSMMLMKTTRTNLMRCIIFTLCLIVCTCFIVRARRQRNSRHQSLEHPLVWMQNTTLLPLQALMRKALLKNEADYKNVNYGMFHVFACYQQSYTVSNIHCFSFCRPMVIIIVCAFLSLLIAAIIAIIFSIIADNTEVKYLLLRLHKQASKWITVHSKIFSIKPRSQPNLRSK